MPNKSNYCRVCIKSNHNPCENPTPSEEFDETPDTCILAQIYKHFYLKSNKFSQYWDIDLRSDGGGIIPKLKELGIFEEWSKGTYEVNKERIKELLEKHRCFDYEKWIETTKIGAQV